MNVKNINTYWEKIYIAGEYNEVKRICQKFCYGMGLCVTIEKCDFVYTGGAEAGTVVGLINYPKFPTTQQNISETAHKLATTLREELYQDSVLIQTPHFTTWISRRDDGSKNNGTK